MLRHPFMCTQAHEPAGSVLMVVFPDGTELCSPTFMSHLSRTPNTYLYLRLGFTSTLANERTNKQTNSIEQSPWEANSHSASQEFHHFLWNPKFHYCVGKGPPLVPILSHIHPYHTFPPNFRKINFNVILPSTPWSSEWILPFRFPD
jgi:hypothetical protein